MMSAKRFKITLVSGLIVLVATFVLKHYQQIPDSIAGFLYGISYGMLGVCVFQIAKQKRAGN